MRLRYQADRRTVFTVFMYYVIAALSYIYFPSQWYLIIPVFIVNALMSFFCAIIVHNTVHTPIFEKKIWNKIFQVFLSFSYGHSVSAFVSGHNFSHHKHTQSLKDRTRTTKLRFKWNLLNQLLFFFVVIPGIVKDENEFTKLMFKEKRKWFWQYVIEMAFVISIKVTLIVLNPLAGVFVFVLPHLYAVWGILGTNYWQHDGCDENHAYNHTRNFTGKLLNYVAFNNGYHSAHHAKPNLHWSKLPEYHEKHIVPYIHPNLNLVSLPKYLVEAHIYPGKRLDYLGNPVVLDEDNNDKDWIEEVRTNVSQNKYDLAVEN